MVNVRDNRKITYMIHLVTTDFKACLRMQIAQKTRAHDVPLFFALAKLLFYGKSVNFAKKI